MKKLFAVIAAVVLTGCSASKVPEIKRNAAATFKQAGFDIVGYEGFVYGSFGTYGGQVYYTLRRIPDNGITYSAFVSEWDGEYHIYNLKAIDAIKPN